MMKTAQTMCLQVSLTAMTIVLKTRCHYALAIIYKNSKLHCPVRMFIVRDCNCVNIILTNCVFLNFTKAGNRSCYDCKMLSIL